MTFTFMKIQKQVERNWKSTDKNSSAVLDRIAEPTLHDNEFVAPIVGWTDERKMVKPIKKQLILRRMLTQVRSFPANQKPTHRARRSGMLHCCFWIKQTLKSQFQTLIITNFLTYCVTANPSQLASPIAAMNLRRRLVSFRGIVGPS